MGGTALRRCLPQTISEKRQRIYLIVASKLHIKRRLQCFVFDSLSRPLGYFLSRHLICIIDPPRSTNNVIKLDFVEVLKPFRGSSSRKFEFAAGWPARDPSGAHYGTMIRLRKPLRSMATNTKYINPQFVVNIVILSFQIILKIVLKDNLLTNDCNIIATTIPTPLTLPQYPLHSHKGSQKLHYLTSLIILGRHRRKPRSPKVV